MPRPTPNPNVDEVDVARSHEYALLAALLARAPNQELLDRLSTCVGDASPLGLAHAALAEAASRTNADLVEREFFNLFIGLGRGELLPYGSYYLTGFLHERPLARLRESLAQLGIERVEGQAEPEDHVAILCEVMAGLIGGRFRRPRRMPTASSSTCISRRGSAASSRTSSGLRAATSTAMSARSAGC